MSLGPAFDSILVAAQVGAGVGTEASTSRWRRRWPPYVRAQGVAEPDDVTGDVFVAVLTRLPAFDGDEQQFRRWVFTIAYRRVVDEWRAKGRRDTYSPPQTSTASTVPTAEDVALARLGDERVGELLATLTPDQRQVLALRVVADLSIDQVAALMGKPVGAVKSLQHRALGSLRRTVAGEAVSR